MLNIRTCWPVRSVIDCIILWKLAKGNLANTKRAPSKSLALTNILSPFRLLPEMFAYCVGAAHLKLAHQVALSFMVSDFASSGEGWRDIDKMDAADVCREDVEPDTMPWVLHFCQRYALGDWFFGKYRLPTDFLTCESPLMAEPPIDVATKYDYAQYPGGDYKKWTTPTIVKRNGFLLCRMIRIVNGAATYFKRNHCGDDANFEKSLKYSLDKKR